MPQPLRSFSFLYIAGFPTYNFPVVTSDSGSDSAHPLLVSVDAEIKSSVDKQLAARGFTKVDVDKSDLVVAYQTAVGQEKEWTGYGMGGGVRWGGMASASSQTISVGTIVLDFYDPTAKTLVWQGRATKSIDPGTNQEKTQKNLDKSIAKLLKKFPPQAK